MSQHLKSRGRWLLLFLTTVFVGVPWYWPGARGLEGWLIPAWAWVALGAAWLLSMLVVWGAMRGWPDEDADG